MKVFFSISLVVSPEKRQEIIKTFRSVTGRTQARADCISCRLFRDMDNSNILLFQEEWESREGLEKHICSDDFRRILAAMDLAIEKPDISIKTFPNTDGMEEIRLIREKSPTHRAVTN